MRKRKTKIRPPRTRTRTVRFPYIVTRDGKETRHRARLTARFNATDDAYLPTPTQLAAVIRRYIPGGAKHHHVQFDDDSYGDMFFSGSDQFDANVCNVWRSGSGRGQQISGYFELLGDTEVVFTVPVVERAPWYYSSDFVSRYGRFGAATARKKGGSARAR